MLLKVNFQKKQTISEQVHCKGISRMESEEEGSIEEARYKVLEIFGKAKGMKALTETMALGQNGREYGREDVGRVKDHRSQKVKFRQINKIIK